MNIILDSLPETVFIDNKEYPINSDFRTSILYEIMMQDTSLSDEKKVLKALELYYPKIPYDINAAIDNLIWFYNCGKRTEVKKAIEEEKEDEYDTNQKIVYSFEYDADYIYAAYLSQYNIDLEKIENLHWWKFRAMFNGLDEKCEFVKIMGYRSVKINNKMSKREKEFYRKMKRIYALPVSDDVQERHDAITKALMNGEDLTGLI